MRVSVAMIALLMLVAGATQPLRAEPGPLNEPATAADVFRTPRAGDLVKLRSGGPLMQVQRIRGDQADCTWIEFERPVSGTFPISSLMIGVFRGAPDDTKTMSTRE